MKKVFTLFLFPLIFVLLFTSSCSRLDLVVYFADNYVVGKVDDYFDLTSEQKKWLKTALKTDIEKVKKIIFPQLAQEFLRVADVLKSDRVLESEDVYLSYQRVRNLFYQGARIFAPHAVNFTESLSKEQIDFFQKELREKFVKMHQEATIKNQYKRMKKNFDSWIGSLSSGQKNQIENFVKTEPPIIHEKIYNRQLMAHNFVKSFPNKEERGRYVYNLFTQYDSMRMPHYGAVADAYDKKVVAFVTNFINEIRPDQREDLVANLRDKANQLIKLSK